jgi:hypothetical protein
VGVPRVSSVQVQPKVANILWSGNRNVVKEDRRAGLTTECEGEVGTLGPIHLNACTSFEWWKGDPKGFGKWCLDQGH